MPKLALLSQGRVMRRIGVHSLNKNTIYINVRNPMTYVAISIPFDTGASKSESKSGVDSSC